MADREERALGDEQERKRLKEEKNALKNEQKRQKKEAKERAKELARQEGELDGGDSAGSRISAALVTFFIVCIWLVILGLLIKLDVGGFGSEILTPILKNVPIVNQILPKNNLPPQEGAEEDAYMGYTNLKDAVDQIKQLELEVERLQTTAKSDDDEVTTLKAEVARLKTFEDKQLEFQRLKTQFAEEVIYAENGPGIDAYQKYYESIDPETAQYLYKQVVVEQQVSTEIKDYAAAYSAMKPKEAAAIFEAMTDNLDLAARILGVMSADSRGKILGVMDSAIAAKITKIMDPDS